MWWGVLLFCLYTLCLVAKHKLSDVLKALSCTILRNVRIEKMYIPYFLEYLPRDLAKIFPSCAGNKKSVMAFIIKDCKWYWKICRSSFLHYAGFIKGRVLLECVGYWEKKIHTVFHQQKIEVACCFINIVHENLK